MVEPKVILELSLYILMTLLIISLWQRRINKVLTEKVVAEIRDSKDRGTDKAIAQHPQIDTQACIGCASCIAGCPESGVLGIVNGVAHIIHGSRCIGHGRCKTACPVDAIQIGLGDVSNRSDIPLLSDDYETSVPGMYIAGELGGIALIRNAIEQGTHVIASLPESTSPHPNEQQNSNVIDVLIVGAGPTGIAASLKAKEQGLRYLTIDQDDVGGTVRKYPRRKLTMTQPFTLPLYGKVKNNEFIKEDLISLWEEIIQKFNLQIKTGIKFLHCEKNKNTFVTETSKGQVYSRFVVLALGRRGTPRRLGVPGEEAEKVLYQLIDAATYKNQKLLVVGGGDSAIEAATGLANQSGNQVTLSYRKKHFFRLKPRNEERLTQYAESGRLQLLMESNLKEISSDSVTIEIDEDGVKKHQEIENDFVFIFAGGEPPFPLLKKLNIRFGGEASEQEQAPPELGRTT